MRIGGQIGAYISNTNTIKFCATFVVAQVAESKVDTAVEEHGCRNTDSYRVHSGLFMCLKSETYQLLLDNGKGKNGGSTEKKVEVG